MSPGAVFGPEDYQAILRHFASLSDEAYKRFNESLIPGAVTAYGVRIPEIRAAARQVIKKDPQGFLAVSRPGSFEEIMLRGMVIAGMKLPMEERLPLAEDFLPLIDNWAVCDTFCSSFRLKSSQDRDLMWSFLRPLFTHSQEFFARFAVVMFLGHFVTEDTVDEGLALLESMPQTAYYVRMAAAWAISVCYVKFPEFTLPLLRRRTLAPFTQNKAIQKIRESRRVPGEDKDMLLQFKLPPA